MLTWPLCHPIKSMLYSSAPQPEAIYSPGPIWQYLEAFFGCHTGEVLLAFRGATKYPAMHSPPQCRIYSMSVVLLLKNPTNKVLIKFSYNEYTKIFLYWKFLNPGMFQM